ncbi:VirK family protein [Pantoea stewartii]|uniref:VirK family protein n=1 Tax=Pantoea stewartii TaxID=66269 RepID=UPI000691C894|nr:VirK family protein [Pantoea stewartii]
MLLSKQSASSDRKYRLYASKFAMLATFLCIFSQSAFASTLNTVSEINQALMKGKDINLSIDLTQCFDRENNIKGTMRGGMKIMSYLIRPDGSLAFSDMHQTVNNKDKPQVQFLRYRSKDENTIGFSMRTFTLPDWKPYGNPAQYECAINKGIVFYSHDQD